jgi:hypothetical protein
MRYASLCSVLFSTLAFHMYRHACVYLGVLLVGPTGVTDARWMLDNAQHRSGDV